MSSLTLAIPTFNAHPAHLREALDSIASQSRVGEVEVIVVDNASNVDGAQFLAECSLHFPQFTFIRHESNLGYDRNVMRLLEQTMSDFVWFFGDDDILFDGAVDAMLSSLAAHPEAKTFLSQAVFFHETADLTGRAHRTDGGHTVMRGVDYIRATAFTAAALSTMCVEVNSMKSVPLEFAIGTNWIHFAALLAVFSVDPEPTGVVIEQDLLAVRRSNATRWFTNFGNQYKSGLTLISMVSDGRSFGLREELYTFFRDKRYAANLIDILTLAWPLTTQDRRSLFRESRAHFGHRIRFRLIDGPLLCSPNWVKAFASGTISLTGRAKRALMKKS